MDSEGFLPYRVLPGIFLGQFAENLFPTFPLLNHACIAIPSLHPPWLGIRFVDAFWTFYLVFINQVTHPLQLLLCYSLKFFQDLHWPFPTHWAFHMWSAFCHVVFGLVEGSQNLWMNHLPIQLKYWVTELHSTDLTLLAVHIGQWKVSPASSISSSLSVFFVSYMFRDCVQHLVFFSLTLSLLLLYVIQLHQPFSSPHSCWLRGFGAIKRSFLFTSRWQSASSWVASPWQPHLGFSALSAFFS